MPETKPVNPPDMLFNKNTKSAVRWVWIVLSVIIIASMLFAYSGGAIL